MNRNKRLANTPYLRVLYSDWGALIQANWALNVKIKDAYGPKLKKNDRLWWEIQVEEKKNPSSLWSKRLRERRGTWSAPKEVFSFPILFFNTQKKSPGPVETKTESTLTRSTERNSSLPCTFCAEWTCRAGACIERFLSSSHAGVLSFPKDVK